MLLSCRLAHPSSTILFQRSSYDGWFSVMHDTLSLISSDTKLLSKKHLLIKLLKSTLSEDALRTAFILSDGVFPSLFTVKPLLSGLLLNGHPLLNRHLSHSQKAVTWLTVNLIATKRSPFRILNLQILLYFTSIKQSCDQLQCDISGYLYTKICEPRPVSFNSTSHTTWYE